MIKVLIKSKYFKILFLVIVVAMLVLAGSSRMLTGRMNLPDESLEKLKSQGIDVVLSFGEYRELKLIDGDDNLAAGKNNDGIWEIIDLETRKTAVLDGIDYVDEGGRDMVVLKADKGYIAADTDRLLKKGQLTDKGIIERCEDA